MYGRLATSTLASTGTWAKVYTVSANSKGLEMDINVLNPGATDATIEVAYSMNTSAPTTDDNVEQGISIKALGGTLIRTGEKLSSGECVYVKTNLAGIKVRVSGKSI